MDMDAAERTSFTASIRDLLFTGRVRELARRERGNGPHTGWNATGDSLETDGRIVVVLLR
jgi:hypothetical protein